MRTQGLSPRQDSQMMGKSERSQPSASRSLSILCAIFGSALYCPGPKLYIQRSSPTLDWVTVASSSGVRWFPSLKGGRRCQTLAAGEYGFGFVCVLSVICLVANYCRYFPIFLSFIFLPYFQNISETSTTKKKKSETI